MTKDPKDPRKWTNVEIENDSDGYLEAMANYREEQEKGQRQARYDADLAQFTQQYVAAGGDESEAEEAFKAHRNKQAAIAAEQSDVETYNASRRRVRSVL
jgi:hypothetical protein